MKKSLLPIFIYFFILNSYAQINKTRAKLYFNDSTVVKGYARLSGKNIRFSKIKNKSKEIKYNYKDLYRVDLRINDKYVSFYYKVIKIGKAPVLMEKIITGKVNLYRRNITFKGDTPIFDGEPEGFKKGNFGSRSGSVSYYLEKNEAKMVTKFKKKFTKEAKEYFKGCPELEKKIGKKNFRRKDILDIVEIYNECN